MGSYKYKYNFEFVIISMIVWTTWTLLGCVFFVNTSVSFGGIINEVWGKKYLAIWQYCQTTAVQNRSIYSFIQFHSIDSFKDNTIRTTSLLIVV